LQIPRLIFWVTAPAENNNNICKHHRFVLFTGIIISLKALFSEHEEEAASIQEA